MAELDIRIPTDGFFLEAMYEEGKGRNVVILCHPHPLYGGSMDNNVVLALKEAVRTCGWATLRFNFRGVGGSGGKYENGEGEVEDVMSVAAYLEQEGKVVHIAGYSFGAWISLKSIRRGLEASSLILISPPLDFLSFADLKLPSRPCLITLGDSDNFSSTRSLSQWLRAQSSPESSVDVEIIPGGDHFYWSREDTLSVRVKRFLQERFQGMCF